MTIVQRNFEYEPTGMGIIKFHSWLMKHDKIQHFPYKVWDILYTGLCLAEEIHWTDARKNDRRPYIHHQIEMIIDYITKYAEEKISSNDILVLALHDAIEDHPECWMTILDKFGLQIFRDVLVLSTGGLPLHIRADMMSYFLKAIGDESTTSRQQDILIDIIHIVNPADPLFKLLNESIYSDSLSSPESQKIENAIRLYAQEICIKKGGINPEECYKDQSYIGLGNYLYFNQSDVRRKLQDMLNNMSDMETMERRKPGYIQTRRIKAYILAVKLKNFGMQDEFAELTQAFHNAEYDMMTDAEVIEKFRLPQS